MSVLLEQTEKSYNFDFNSASIMSYSKMNNLSLLEQVAFVARVSNPGNQSNHKTSEKLVSYLIKNQHWSPLEMVNICLEINTTREISKQMLRHRSFSFQEFSQRYAVVSEDFVIKECRFQDFKNRQNSLELTDSINDQKISSRFIEMQEDLAKKEKEYYNFCIENNIAKEVARCILSEGMTKTRLYMNGSIRSWLHYLKARMDKSTQKEHRDIAIKIANEIETIFPISKYLDYYTD